MRPGAALRSANRRLLLAAAVALASVALAVVWSAGRLGWRITQPRETELAPAQGLIEQQALSFARPEGFVEYWMKRAPELDPIEDADVIVAGTVAVIRLKGVKRAVDGRTPRDWLIGVEFDVACPIKGLGAHTNRIGLSYVFSQSQYMGGLDGDQPHLLGPGLSYVLMLKRPGWGRRDFPFDPKGDPPPIPLATIDPAACGDGTPEERITALLIASRRVTDSDLRWYTAPVLGYLTHFHGQAEARAELLRAVRSDDARDVRDGFRWLTEWDRADADVLAAAAERTSDDDPEISAEALAVRIEADGTTALLGEVVAWARRPGVPDTVPLALVMALGEVHPTSADAELLRQYEELLSPRVPTGLRGAAVRQLAEIGTMEVAPLLARALDDPMPWIRQVAIEGLYKASQSPGAPDLTEHVPNPKEFEADPDKYTSFWKQWWETAAQGGWPPEGTRPPGVEPGMDPGMEPGMQPISAAPRFPPPPEGTVGR